MTAAGKAMDSKSLRHLLLNAQIEAVLLDGLQFERGPVADLTGLHITEEVRTIEPRVEEPDQLHIVLRVTLVGRAVTAEQAESSEFPTDADVAFRLTAAVSAHYRCALEHVALEVVTAFARTSAVMHLNAYMRQFVQDTLARAGFPGVVMPLIPVSLPAAATAPKAQAGSNG